MTCDGLLFGTWLEQECLGKSAMAMSGHKTRSVFDRYNIVNEVDLEREKLKMIPLAKLKGYNSGKNDTELVGMSAGSMELARGIEPPTCGLQNSESLTSDNLTPQETTNQDTGIVGADGTSLSSPGSSVVAKLEDTEG